MNTVTRSRALLHDAVFKLIIPRNRAFAELQKKRGVVQFMVPLNYSKPQIKAYLYQLYGIKPLHVSTQITFPRLDSFTDIVKKKYHPFRQKSRKIAYITLHDNDEWSPKWGFYEEDDKYRAHFGIPDPEGDARKKREQEQSELSDPAESYNEDESDGDDESSDGDSGKKSESKN